MGIYLNPDNENLKSTLKREIYVDKTQMISVLNKFIDCDNKYLCISRPRRFGKTFANNMLSGESVDVNVTRYMNTMTDFSTRSDAFTYLIHLGYLAFNKEDSTCRIPNKEVRQEWFNAIETNKEYAVTNKIIQGSKEL